MKDQRIQCVKCWHFRRYDPEMIIGYCGLYEKDVLDTDSCNLKEKRLKENVTPIIDEQTERECEA